MYIVTLFPVTQLLFYQRILAGFGNFGRIEFRRPLDIGFLASRVKQYECDVALTLEQHREMLLDYFSIDIENGRLKALPYLLEGYRPSFTALPLFLHRLASEIDWDCEMECISGVARELSMLYAILPEDVKDAGQGRRLKDEITNVILPELKSGRFLPHSRLMSEGWVMMLKTVPQMYQIFERT
jgi:DNA mismatch repair protein MLH1